MKKLIYEIFYGKNVRFGGLAAFGFLIVLGCNCNETLSDIAKNANSSSTSNTSSDTPFTANGTEDVPSTSISASMVKATTSDFAKAIETNNFSDIYQKASSDFKSTYTEQQMKDAFKIFTDKQSVVVPILRKAEAMEPEFSPSPSFRTEKGLSILVLHGRYPTKPVPTRFEYEYVKREGQWKLLKLIVKLQ